MSPDWNISKKQFAQRVDTKTPRVFKNEFSTEAHFLFKWEILEEANKYLHNEIVPVTDASNVMREAYVEKLGKKGNNANVTSIMPNIETVASLDIELDVECVARVIRESRKCVTNCPIRPDSRRAGVFDSSSSNIILQNCCKQGS